MRRRLWALVSAASVASCAALPGALAAGAAGSAPPAASKPSDKTAGVAWFKGTVEEALVAARAQKKLVLFDAWATWCRYCHEMDRDVWERDDVGRALAREVVPVRAEVDTLAGVGLALRDRFDIGGLPCVLFLDPESGREITRVEGYQPSESILAALDRAREAVKTLRANPAAAAGRGADDDLIRAAARLWREGQKDEAKRTLAQAAASDKDCARDVLDDSALLLADLQERTEDRAGALAALRGAADVCQTASGLDEIWRRIVTLARAINSPDLGALIKRRAAVFPDDPSAGLDAARWALEQSGDLDAAERGAKKLLQMQAEDTGALAVLAEVEFKRHHLDAAQALIERAIRIDPHDPSLRELRLKIMLSARQAG